MLYLWLAPLASDYGFLNLFRYLTFRTGGALMTALVISFIVGPSMIRWLKSKQRKGQPIRDDGPQSHIVKKQGTPTMGVFAVTIGFGIIGFVDDYIKVTKGNSGGVPGKLKLVAEFIIASVAVYWITILSSPTLAIPFAKDMLLDLGLFYIPFGILVIVGASNAVNLTDGLDGLATMPVIIAASAFGLISYLVGNTVYSEYLQITPVAGAGELAVFLGALIGSCLGFLWFNAPPAMVFMGDTGSLSLGGALGSVSVVTKHELVLVIIGGLFVLETVSVIIQIVSFKLTGKRVFRMAPIHHHFEEKGWAESTIVIRFWIIALILALIGLSSLKLR